MVRILLQLMLKVSLLVALGYFIKKRGMVDDDFERRLSTLLLEVIFPISIIVSSNSDFSVDKLKNIVLIAVIASLYYVGAILLTTQVGRWMKFPKENIPVFMTSATFANTAYVGIPVCQVLYGNEGALYAMIYTMIYQVFFFSYGIAKLSGGEEVRIKDAWNTITKTVVVALILFFAQVKFPAPILDTMSAVGNMVIPISMMIIGFGLTDIHFIDIFKDMEAYCMSFVRLLLLPSIVFAGCRLCGLSNIVTMSATIMSAPPSGSMNIIITKQYGLNAEYATKAVIQSMILGVFTIPLVVATASKLLL